ncbi:hypothetical protein MYCTH_2315050 [Thermothelomyces thermophilus ATCC 42464]|uniref:Uncharacterized protein n=1 Tax=Thermothelomyces thermophilus (strain ATCC 42464 / BCRC 31852 / DSM 1799) TaxID=573729 RepID=G2QD79_THET4|nr:uncharacterized protein MYCTH_2315050 [Thermothelomyces thermophilus ATCC 42464]AEO57445.1 hypothetical protein MYCTH_2315050 [Thermothelomyces thermophilus ATCC 42464]
MDYLLYSLTFLAFLFATILYLTRARWVPPFQDRLHKAHFPGSAYLYSHLGPGSFEDDIEAGLSSSNFDLTGNVEGGDSRSGLDDTAKREILRIMKKRRLKFDEARKVYMEQRFKENGIGADGRPRDPKFVSFS